MFGISSFEFLVILVVGLLVLGPERLPKLLRLAARAASELRRVTVDLQRSINLDAHLNEPISLKKQAEELFLGFNKRPAQRAAKSSKTAASASPPPPESSPGAPAPCADAREPAPSAQPVDSAEPGERA